LSEMAGFGQNLFELPERRAYMDDDTSS